MEKLSKVLSFIAGAIWGTPILVLLLGGGLYLLWISRFIPFQGLRTALQLITQKTDTSDSSKGQLSPFQALTNSLAATVGLGNMSGVAVAITQGGAGAIFWMWVAAIIGMNTKFFEATLSILYRGKDYKGEVQGGPMYIISNGLSRMWKPAAIFVAICGAFVFNGLFTSNQIAAYFHFQYETPKLYLGIGFAVICFWVLMGGLKKIALFSSKLVPLMSILYVLGGSLICIKNYDKIIPLFQTILSEAFAFESIFGGVSGISIIAIIQIGFRRATLSNEAGIGTASMAHGNANTDQPVKEGLVAMLGPFLDTIVICSMTAYVILLGLEPTEMKKLNGILMVTQSFNNAFPVFGSIIVSLSVFLFGFTSLIGIANFALKSWDYLFRGWGILNDTTFNIWYCVTIILGSVATLKVVISLVDILYGLLATMNMIAILILAPKVKVEIVSFFNLKNLEGKTR